MFPSHQFAQCTHMAGLCQFSCGEAPAAWCGAKRNHGLMWVAPAATDSRFIYLGTDAGTRENQQECSIALEAADITRNIKLPCHISSLKWKLDHLHSHAFTPTVSIVVAFPTVMSWFNFSLSMITSKDVYFQCLLEIMPLKYCCTRTVVRSIWLHGKKNSL